MSNHPYLKAIFHKILILPLFLLLLINVRAQTKFGITAGVGKTSLYRFPYEVEDYNKFSSITSFWGGLTADLPINKKGINLFSTLVYSKKGYQYSLQNQTGANNTIKDSGYSQDLRYIDLNLKVLKKFSWNDVSSFFVGTGPSASLFLSGSEKTSMNYFGNNLLSVNNTQSKLSVGNSPGTYKRAFFSWGFALGFELNRVNVWVNYDIPLSNYYQDANKALPHNLKTIGVNVSYTLFSRNGEPREKREKKEKPSITPAIAKDTLVDTDGDGIRDIDDKCPGHKGTAKYLGCPVPDTDGDGINDEEDNCPTVAGKPGGNGCPQFVDTVRQTPKDTMVFIVYFEPGKSELRTEGFNTLTEVVRLLKNNKKLMVLFKGHTDNVGSVEANSIRSFDRAKVCADYVASFFIDRHRLVAAAYSNKQPAADLNDPLLQWKNRRVEVCVYEVDE